MVVVQVDVKDIYGMLILILSRLIVTDMLARDICN